MNARIINVNAASLGLDAKFDGIVNQFLASEVGESGWTWRDAMEATIERGDVVDIAATPLMRFLQSRVSKGWTWQAAIEATIDAGHQVDLAELPLAAFASDLDSTDGDEEAAESDASEMVADTGWTWGDAIAMRDECRRESIHFGRRRRLH